MAKTSYLTTRILATMKQEIERIAVAERRSVSQIAEFLLEIGLKEKSPGWHRGIVQRNGKAK